MSKKLRLISGTAAALSLFTAGCGGSSPGPANEAKAGTVAGIVAEFAEFGDSPELLAARNKEAQNLIIQCMAEKGFEAERGPLRPPSLLRTNNNGLPGWILLRVTADEAKTDGIGLVPLQDRELRDAGIDPDAMLILDPNYDDNPDAVSSEEFAFDSALYGFSGVDADSSPAEPACYDQAIAEVGPLSLGEAVSLIDMESELERFSRFLADGEIRDMSHDWQKCMSESGYNGVEDPFQFGAIEHFFWNEMVPQEMASQGRVDTDDLEDGQFDLDPDVLSVARSLESEFAVAFIACIQPHREVLSAKWKEYLGYNFD